MTADGLMLVAGLFGFSVTVYCVRKRQMREKHALLWLFLGLTLVVIGFFPALLKGFAHAFHLAYPTAALFIAISVIYVFALSVSISASQQHRRINTLLQEVAILRQRVLELERRGDDEIVR